MPLFRRKEVECFFCLSPQSAPAAARAASAFRCEACQCWNVRDKRGTIVSDLPAMHNSALNNDNFALRGKPSSSRLPSTASSPFCRDCITNQTLVMNLLGNYLPDESDPSYTTLSADLPRYIASLHERYPPVCAKCQPAVDEILKRADQKAQAEAWGRALRRGRDMVLPQSSVGAFEVGVWRARGVLWVLDAAASWGLGVAAYLRPEELGRLVNASILGVRATSLLLSIRAMSILWILWDPTWLRRARADGSLRVEGRSTWVMTMLAVACLRAGAAIYLSMWRRKSSTSPTVLIQTAVSDIITLVIALWQLRLTEPVPLTLVRPIQTSSPPVPAFSLSSLSLDATPTPPPPQPVFGQPSLARLTPLESDVSEPMDWEPTPGSRTPEEGSTWDRFGVGRQRMFPNENGSDETGLESLLAGWGISTGTAPSQPLPTAPLAPRRGLVLDERLLRRIRYFLLALRFGALVAAMGSYAVGLRIHDFAGTALRTLLASEAAASALGLIVCLASSTGRLLPLAAIVLVSDAVVRTSALLSTRVPTSLPHEALAWAGPEITCAAWAVLDIMVLAST